MKIKFELGSKVSIDASLTAVIEEIILVRNMKTPRYRVSYWLEGKINYEILEEEDLTCLGGF